MSCLHAAALSGWRARLLSLETHERTSGYAMFNEKGGSRGRRLSSDAGRRLLLGRTRGLAGGGRRGRLVPVLVRPFRAPCVEVLVELRLMLLAVVVIVAVQL